MNQDDPTPQRWQRIGGHTAFANRWLRVNIDQVELPTGQTYDYTVIRRHQHGAAVLAFDDQGRVLMQQEYRYPVDAVVWQLPGGLIDPAETPLAAAQRELAEETGHVADKWRLLGVFWDNPALEDMIVHVFIAEDARPDGQEDRDEAEWVHCQWQDMAWLRAQVCAGAIRERILLAALGLMWAQGDPRLGL